MQLSSEQTACIQAIAAPSQSSLIIIAGAGCAKTTTLVKGLHQNKLFPATTLAFNKRNAEELNLKLPAHNRALTLNALGHQTFKQNTKAHPKLSFNKTTNLIKELFPKHPAHNDLAKLVNIAKASGLGIPARSISGLLPFEALSDLAEHYDLEFSDELAAQTHAILAASWDMAFKTQTIDFADQLYLPILANHTFRKFNCLAIDEAQDLSPIQHQMALRSINQNSFLVAVGDPFQAIYGFRGAHTSSMDALADILPNGRPQSLSLSQSFRCPQSVIRLAQEFVPFIRASDFAPEGSVQFVEPTVDIPPGHTILCRYNAPLIRKAFTLLHAGQPFEYIGKDFLQGLISILKRLPKTTEPLQALASWAEAEISKKPKQAVTIEDKSQALTHILSQAKTVEAAIRAIQALSDSKNGTVLSTIHKAKGLEWPNVWLILHKPWEQLQKLKDPASWQDGQERNALYVAITRAQQNLYLINPASGD